MAEKTDTEEGQKYADYLAAITQYEREFKKWEGRCDKILKRYRDDNRQGAGAKTVRFNILWSNVQTLVPATYSRVPQPDVSRRFRDNDPVGRVAALLLERALEYEVQHYPDYQATMRQDVFDRFLGARGTAWVRYEPHFRAAAEGLPTDGEQVTEDIDEPREELDYECSPCDYVNPKDFGHTVARTWEEVGRVWRVVYMYEDAIRERFGEEWAKKIPYDASPQKEEKNTGGDRTPKQAKIYEIWDKETKKAIWLSRALSKIIEERDDPLQLAEFFPCPRPLYGTLTNDTLVPVPDFVLYQDQADELDILSDRIDGLVKALQVKGVYDAATPELARLFTEGGNNDMIPVKNFAAFAEKNGLKGSLDLVDLTPFANALKEAYLAMSQIKEYVYEITGISDIVRGQSEASETLGAQQIKQNFVGLRLKTMQNEVARFASEMIQIKAQIICGKYSPETIIQISAAEQLSDADKELIPQALELLLGPERMQDPSAPIGPNPLRAFRVEVSADSLVQMDEQAEKEARMEFLKATGGFMKDALPVAQASPELAPLIVQMMKFGAAAFKVGKTIEGDFDQTLDRMKQAAQQPKPPPVDPEMEKLKAEQQAEQVRMQMEQQQEQARVQADIAIATAKGQAEMQLEQQRMTMEARFEQERMAREMQMAQMQAKMDAQLEMMKARLEAETKIEVAEIGAAASLSAAQTSAAEDAVE